MIRTQIQFRDEQLQSLRARAMRDQVSISALVRQAVDAWVKDDTGATDDEKIRRAIAAGGRFASGLHDVARKHDAYLADDLHR
jgi:hypothetical protein